MTVYVPKITSPAAGTVWTAGNTYTVTWDTSDAPESISNGSKVVLAKGGSQDYQHPLAEGFDLRAGSVEITIPAGTAAGSDYAIVLFGDSGNYSPEFTIQA
ncbi:GPI anchored serine-threonine rich family protein [Phanerochaete sordida]|uniref:GPI anchored serine-threonine rich family protein n=1 Tax=Phanerochaete sordida TaxID=48140 RepID=A0A9P3LKQ0_9APHY|nr:GPI anchored serine-threonine rich family protein [Phanerochaete sordida]